MALGFAALVCKGMSTIAVLVETSTVTTSLHSSLLSLLTV